MGTETMRPKQEPVRPDDRQPAAQPQKHRPAPSACADRATAGDPLPPEVPPGSPPEITSEPPTEIPSEPPTEIPPAPPTEIPSQPPPEIPQDLSPDLETVATITAETDLAPFLKPGVPAAIRNAALRRKWLLNPTIRDYVDPALDYAWDWNAAEAVPGAGGRILADSARKMLDRLTGGSAAPTDAKPASANRPARPDTQTAPAAARNPAAPAEPVESAPETISPGEPQSVAAAPHDPPRRRHGGALPRPRG